MGVEIFVLLLIAFMFVAALIAVETEDLLSSVIAIGAVGFGLSVIDLLLGAPDLAITQVVVEVIALVLLIRVVLTRREQSAESTRDHLRTAVVVLGAGVLLVVVFFAVGGMSRNTEGTVPEFGQPLFARDAGADKVGPGVGRDYVEKAVEETGAANAVMAVLLDYRAYDTLGEATVIFVSILGAYALLRRIGRKKEGAA
jgi:multisubunit Na+/H+ antiporter MnhB subunit